MPTTTSLSNWYFINAGPLTTTFTAPESCSTALEATALAQTIEGEFQLRYEFDCDQPGYEDCIPSGSSLDTLYHSLGTQRPDPTYQAFYYHSPGLYCPSGWVTMGTAERDADGELKTSGQPYEAHIVLTTPATTTMPPQVNPGEQVFAEALDNGETAVLCCPSGYTAMPGGFPCYSSLNTEIGSTEVCNIYATEGVSMVDATFTYGDETITGYALSDAGPTRAMETRYETLLPSDIAEQSLVPVVYAPVITLVYREGDDGTPDDGESGDDGDGDGNGDGSGGSGDGEGAGVSWGATGVIPGALGVAALAGAALL